MKKIDILLASYNGEQYIKEQLDSILSQTYSNFRLLISDDMSTDNTRSILEEYKEKDDRIELYFQEKNQGVVKNFEFLLKKVQSEYFMFSDQDDVWKQNKVELCLNKIQEKDYNLVYTDLKVVDEDLKVIHKSYWKLKGIRRKVKKYNNFESLYLNNFITGCTIISKKDLIEKVLPLPKTTKYVLHDYWLSLIASQYGKIAYIDEALVKYRQHKDNKIGSSKKSDELETLDEIRELFIRVKKEHFEAFVDNEDRFVSHQVKVLNRKALKYYKHLREVKNINFKNWGLFFKLYKYESFNYTIQNFLILNIPILARFLFFIKNRKVKDKWKQ